MGELVYCKKHRTVVPRRSPDKKKWCCVEAEVERLESQKLEDIDKSLYAAKNIMESVLTEMRRFEPKRGAKWLNWHATYSAVKGWLAALQGESDG